MRWVVFIVFALLGLVFDTGLNEVLRIEKLGNIRPGLCGVVAVFVALSAPRTTALWACLVLGLLLDLSHPLTVAENRVVYLIGPYALGFALGGWLVIAGRAMVFRRRPLTIGVMTVLCLLAVLYSGFIAIPVGWLLVQTIGLWGFQTMPHRPPTIR
ncbi:MAG: rod shape-determining protein MreD [Planctomycetota bacterium]|jgi:cell shape-determining protein MreD